jgi:hypothetical protein
LEDRGHEEVRVPKRRCLEFGRRATEDAGHATDAGRLVALQLGKSLGAEFDLKALKVVGADPPGEVPLRFEGDCRWCADLARLFVQEDGWKAFDGGLGDFQVLGADVDAEEAVGSRDQRQEEHHLSHFRSAPPSK